MSGTVTNALAKAGIEARWVKRSSKRQMREVQQNKSAVCSPGWFKKPEREVFAKFSSPVYQDQPQIIVARADKAGDISHTTLKSLFQDNALKLSVKMGYSYGSFIDNMRKQLKPNTVETSQDIGGITRMLLGRRFDYFIAAPEEYQSLAERLGIAGEDIVSLQMRDIPPGNKRYLMCSEKVPDGLLNRFNAGLKGLPGVPAAD